jgi:hypothetical protein
MTCKDRLANVPTGFIYFACYNYFASEYYPSLPHYGTCGAKRQEAAAFTGCAIISSYLVLFIMFYFSTYKKPSAKKAVRRASKVEVPTIKQTGEMAAGAVRAATHVISEKIQGDTNHSSVAHR